MIIDLIEHSRGTLRNVEFVGVGRSVKKPGRVRQNISKWDVFDESLLMVAR
jgi:hypothetical protein